MKRHELKTTRAYFNAQAVGLKQFELRRLDRDFSVGDEINLIEIDSDGLPTGRTLLVGIIYILTSFEGLEDGFGILGTEWGTAVRKNTMPHDEIKALADQLEYYQAWCRDPGLWHPNPDELALAVDKAIVLLRETVDDTPSDLWSHSLWRNQMEDTAVREVKELIRRLEIYQISRNSIIHKPTRISTDQATAIELLKSMVMGAESSPVQVTGTNGVNPLSTGVNKMRKIEEQMVAAVRERRTWSGSNTRVVYTHHDSAYVYLFNNHIATVKYNTGLIVWNVSTLWRWPTATTKSRLRALKAGLPEFDPADGGLELPFDI